MQSRSEEDLFISAYMNKKEDSKGDLQFKVLDKKLRDHCLHRTELFIYLDIPHHAVNLATSCSAFGLRASPGTPSTSTSTLGGRSPAAPRRKRRRSRNPRRRHQRGPHPHLSLDLTTSTRDNTWSQGTKTPSRPRH